MNIDRDDEWAARMRDQWLSFREMTPQEADATFARFVHWFVRASAQGRFRSIYVKRKFPQMPRWLLSPEVVPPTATLRESGHLKGSDDLVLVALDEPVNGEGWLVRGTDRSLITLFNRAMRSIQDNGIIMTTSVPPVGWVFSDDCGKHMLVMGAGDRR